jgi:hypothetical protein
VGIKSVYILTNVFKLFMACSHFHVFQTVILIFVLAPGVWRQQGWAASVVRNGQVSTGLLILHTHFLRSSAFLLKYRPSLYISSLKLFFWNLQNYSPMQSESLLDFYNFYWGAFHPKEKTLLKSDIWFVYLHACVRSHTNNINYSEYIDRFSGYLIVRNPDSIYFLNFVFIDL